MAEQPPQFIYFLRPKRFGDASQGADRRRSEGSDGTSNYL